MSAYGERIARVEVEVQELKREFKEHKEQTEKNFTDVNKKLDDLLALRNKGAGVLWLIGGIVSTGIVSFIFEVIHWLKG